MKAALFRAAHQPLSVEHVEFDEPLPNEVLIRTVAAGVCHSDLHFIDGHLPSSYLGGRGEFSSAVLGHEGAGVVVAVGDAVTHCVPGDHVVVCLSIFCGTCEHCLRGRPHLCRWTSTFGSRPAHERPRLHQDGRRVDQQMGLGTFAEQILTHENSVVKIDDDLPLEHAALLSCGVLTGMGAVLNTARVEPFASVAVFGCGGVGLAAIQGARIAGAGRIIAIDLLDHKLELARELGATATVNAGRQDPVEAVRQLTGGIGVGYTFDAIGLVRVVRQAVECLAIGGTATIIGSMSPNETLELKANALSLERKLQSSVMGSNKFRIDIPNYVNLYRQGLLRLDALVSHRMGLDEINHAFDLLHTGESIRTVVTFDGAA